MLWDSPRGVVRGRARRECAGRPCGGQGPRREGRAAVRRHCAPEDGRALHERRGGPHEHGSPDRGRSRGIRTGAIPDPTVGYVAALAAVFGVEPSYLVDREGAPPLDAELLEGLRDETTHEITRQALRLPERERGLVLGIVRQFGQGSPPRG
jgi:hypothetical protein